MRKVYFDLENCYGIPKFRYLFEFDDRKKAHLIYAPNGVMKTSFANTVEDISLEQETKDFLYPNRLTKRVVKYDGDSGEDIEKDEILVIKSYSESYKSENVMVLLADNNLKRAFDKLHSEIDEKMDYLFKNLNKLSGKRSAIDLLVNDFGIESKDIYAGLEKLYDEFIDTEIEDFSYIKYGEIINKDSEKILQDENVKTLLRNYIDQYDKLLNESKVFNVEFNHTNAENVLKTLGKDGFFKANHQVLLNSTDEALGEDEFKKIIVDEKKRIIDEEMIGEFNDIDRLLSNKAATRDLRDFIRNNKELIPELLELDEFKKKLWLSYLFNKPEIFQEVILNYKNNKLKIEQIIKDAKKQELMWHEVVKQFNHRFSNMPFELYITNKEDVILKSELPSVSFKYKDRGEVTDVSEEKLLPYLSNGEKKALYLLNVIFEIEARKEMENRTLLIIDDIADSFDYRNKYAIIEYLKEIVDDELFLPIIFTHNFDFYRTVAGRLNIIPCSNFVLRSENELELIHGQYFNNVFDTWRDRVYKNDIIFLSSISFVRNLAEYIYGRDSEIYNNLTSLLHYKKFRRDDIKSTEEILVSDLVYWYEFIWGRDANKFEQDMEQKVYDFLLEEAAKIIDDDIQSEDIEYKIVLSIAIRLKAEKYMIDRINDDEEIIKISKNQTRELRDLIQFDDTEEDNIIQEIIEKVLIITSENIHINSFMYEPIVDMAIEELKKLYREVDGIMPQLASFY